MPTQSSTLHLVDGSSSRYTSPDYCADSDSGKQGRTDPEETYQSGSLHEEPAQADVIPVLTVDSRLKRALREHLRDLGFVRTPEGFLAPSTSSKDGIRSLHRSQRLDRLTADRAFVESKWPRLNHYFANGTEVVPHSIEVQLEEIRSETWQSDLFRLASLTWSVPVSCGYGRRMRFLVWDRSNSKLLGLIALADPVFNLAARDSYIGWDIDGRSERLANVLDAYVLGAIPPYNKLLAGKLVAALVGSQEVRDAFATKYGGSSGLISGKAKSPALALVTTSSALGRSSVYNRLRLSDFRHFKSVGYTSGWGHFHVPNKLFSLMRCYLRERGHSYADNHRFGDGPNWRLRTVRECLRQLGVNQNILRHGIAREIFVCEVAANARPFLKGEQTVLQYEGLPTVRQLTAEARLRWLVPRASRRPEFVEWNRSGILEACRVGPAVQTMMEEQ